MVWHPIWLNHSYNERWFGDVTLEGLDRPCQPWCGGSAVSGLITYSTWRVSLSSWPRWFCPSFTSPCLSVWSPGHFQRGLFKMELEYGGIMHNLAMQGTAKNCGINKDKLVTEPWLTGESTNSAAARSASARETLTPGSKRPLWHQISVSPGMQEGRCSPSHPLAKFFHGPFEGHSLCPAWTEITTK